MSTDDHESHSRANAELVALLKASLDGLSPWDTADEEAPLADPLLAVQSDGPPEDVVPLNPV